MSAIGEESDGELYIDLVDDYIQGDSRQTASLFPSLQDRLSNKRGAYKTPSDAHDNFDYDYTPKKCSIPNGDYVSYNTKSSHASVPQLLLPPPSTSNDDDLIYYGDVELIASPKKNKSQPLDINGETMSTELVPYGNSPMSVIQEINEPLRPRLSEKKLFSEHEEHDDRTSTSIIATPNLDGYRNA